MNIEYALTQENVVLAIDFDGTIVDHQTYLGDGEWTNEVVPVPLALETLRDFVDAGYKLVLWTCRANEKLDQAIEYLAQSGIEFIGINDNPTDWMITPSPKVFCNIYIDDAALGCPLTAGTKERPVVDWAAIRDMFQLD